jgi:hypothetical protein
VLVQTRSNCSNSGSGATLAFSSNVTSGNEVLFSYKSESTGTDPSSITSSLGITYTLAVKLQLGPFNEIWLYTGKAGSTGAETITVNHAHSWDCMNINEFSGLAGTIGNVGSGGIGNGGSSPATWTMTVGAAPAIVYATCGSYSSSSTFTAGGSLVITSQANGADAIVGGWQTNSSTGSITLTYTLTGASDDPCASVAIQ